MAKQPKLYTRLSRPSMSVGSYNTLWLGPDHLLLVNSTGYTEEYRRILLSDIQGIFTVASPGRSLTWQIVWIVIMVICGLVMLTRVLTGETPYVSGVLLGLALIGLIWNKLLGDGCKVYAITRVQTVQLPSLVRRKKARRVLFRLEPLIVAAQKQVTPTLPVEAVRPANGVVAAGASRSSDQRLEDATLRGDAAGAGTPGVAAQPDAQPMPSPEPPL